jgi:peroxiredoxin
VGKERNDTMNRLTKTILVGALLAGVAGQAFAQEKTVEATIASVAIDQPAPDFTLKDIDGKDVKLSQFKGKYVVLEWVNYDCPFVHKHYSTGNMQKLQANFTKKDVVWLSICSSAPGKQGHFPIADLKKRMVAEKAVPTDYLVDENGAIGGLYQAKTTPHMFVVDPKGILRYAGAIDDTPSTKAADVTTATNYVSSALDALLAGKSVAMKSSTPYGCSVKY